ncbi:MAG: hypothetical protein HC802_18210, partial [Caldilineaceae bacterium]|nr:hypothetical protein [Caldilineaceae bacterium]
LLGASMGGEGIRGIQDGWRAALRSWRQWLTTGLVVFGGALLIASPWFMRNWRLYGDPLGLKLAIQTIDVRTGAWTWADTSWLLEGWFRSFWGKFGGAGHIPMPEGFTWRCLG